MSILNGSARAASVGAALTALTLILAGCAGDPAPSTPTAAPLPAPTERPDPTPSDAPEPGLEGFLLPNGEVEAVVTGLAAPWSVVPLETGSVLISERDSARIHEVAPDGSVRDLVTVPGVVPGGEGGLLGLAVHDDTLFVYLTAADDNRVVRAPLSGDAGALEVGEFSEVITGIPKARTHNGGRLLIGPDEKLYVTTGDAQVLEAAQDVDSLAGKILRLELDGTVPADNPVDGSAVYSLGHRNPQGIAFDRDGRLWAAEFGQNAWDELNLIEPGGNYGWPIVEGIGGDDRFIDPVQQWATSEASPSGLGIAGDTLYLAALRGQRLIAVDLANPSESTALFVGEFGRIRDALLGSDGRLWFLTNNTDGRGSPGADDDRLLSVELSPAQ
ncbi:PQQ-dependent sugar dehydrogenase [Microcella sp.]|uniref:PQQ-dependent sugar dehydrogenase n=1 Tax=Microcella sp. TaxID=1913979 RepID=UPI003919AB9A